MSVAIAHGFVDGGHLRATGNKDGKQRFFDPQAVVKNVISMQINRGWAGRFIELGRLGYYDASKEGEENTLDDYFGAVEALQDVELRFGWMRATKAKRPEQKGVDVLLAVDLLTGAFTRVFDVAVLVSGDADLVPAVEEAKRRGVLVIVAGSTESTASKLRAAADRYFPLEAAFGGCEMEFAPK